MSRVLPILFNTDAVRAILDGRKTVTRRSIPIDIANRFDIECDGKTVISFIDQETGDRHKPTDTCRYQKDDVLYVRETWTWCDCCSCEECFNEHTDNNGCYAYKATHEIYGDIKWHPSIHMPKKAARIWLKVTDVRVEKLQDISAVQVVKEGVLNADSESVEELWEHTDIPFAVTWNSTIKKTDFNRYGWDANPWVWVIEFERCEKPEPCVMAGTESAEDKRPCIGYGKSDIDDEPCEMCKSCGSYSGQEE